MAQKKYDFGPEIGVFMPSGFRTTFVFVEEDPETGYVVLVLDGEKRINLSQDPEIKKKIEEIFPGGLKDSICCRKEYTTTGFAGRPVNQYSGENDEGRVTVIVPIDGSTRHTELYAVKY